MDNIWSKMNEETPVYFQNLVERFCFEVVSISDLSTALVSQHFALLISVDRFSVEVAYIMRNKNGNLIRLGCGNYFAEGYDEDDRAGLIDGNDVRTLIINNFKVICHGLLSKWDDALRGDTGWLDGYRLSKWYDERPLSMKESVAFEGLL